MTSDTIFTRGTLTTLVIVGVLAFAGMIVSENISDRMTLQQRSGTTAFSKSAIGHEVFYRFLQGLGYDVQISKNRSARKAGPAGTLLLIEPGSKSALKRIDIRVPGKVILVLPKWRGAPDPKNRGWIGSAELIETAPIREILEPLHILDAFRDLTLRRSHHSLASGPPNPATHLVEIANLQLMNALDFQPIVSFRDGMLVARLNVGAWDFLVISDPDLISNHGIPKAGHASLVRSALRVFLSGSGNRIVLDETIHGIQVDPNLVRTFIQPPFILTTLIALLAAGLLIWSSAGRIGAPVALEQKRMSGKEELIENITQLLLRGNHTGDTFASYHNALRANVAQRLGAPASLDHGGLTEWLGRVGNNLGAADDYRDIYSDVDALRSALKPEQSKMLVTAIRLSRWREEVLHGSSNYRRVV